MNNDVHCYTATRTINVLIHLATGPRSAPELAEILDVAKPTVRRILALLTRGGYVDRLPGDTYRKRYRLTPRGQLLGHQMATAAVFAAPRSDIGRPRRRITLQLTMKHLMLSIALCNRMRRWSCPDDRVTTVKTGADYSPL